MPARSSKLSESTFRVTSECALRAGETAVSEATVTMDGNSAFAMAVEVREGGLRYRATEIGRRIAACTR